MTGACCVNHDSLKETQQRSTQLGPVNSFIQTLDVLHYLFTSQMRTSATRGKLGDLKFSIDINLGYPKALIISVKSEKFTGTRFQYVRRLPILNTFCPSRMVVDHKSFATTPPRAWRGVAGTCVLGGGYLTLILAWFMSGGGGRVGRGCSKTLPTRWQLNKTDSQSDPSLRYGRVEEQLPIVIMEI